MKRLTILGAAILVLGLAGGQGHLARGEDALSDELRELDRMRNGKRTPVDKVELRGKGLLKEHASPEEQGQIYYHLADVHGQSGMVHPELVIEYAQRALQFPIKPAQRLRLYTYWGDALRVANRGKKPFPDIRKMAAEPYLEGLKETKRCQIPEQKPELPVVGRYDMPEDAPMYRQVKKTHDEQMAAWDRIKIEQELWNHRRILTGQIVELYSRQPHAATELRQLATKILQDPVMVDALMKRIEEKGALKDDPIPEKPKLRPLKNPEETRPATPSSRWPTMRSAGALVIVVSGLILWLRHRRLVH